MLALGVLVFVVGTLLVLSAWRVVDATFAVSAAAREAARAFVEGEGDTHAARARAHAAAVEAVTVHGLGTAGVAVELSGSLERCKPVRVDVTYVVPGVVLPWVDGIGDVAVHGSHTELVDPLRGGVDGEADCLA